MKFKAFVETELNITHIVINVPIRYGDEEMPYDFPFRQNDNWRIIVAIDTGEIFGWKTGVAKDLWLTVKDTGTYTLTDDTKKLAELVDEYVPHGVIPGEYGDVIKLDIDENGKILNWPKRPNVEAFFIQAWGR